MKFPLDFYTQYSQFYLVDPTSPADSGAIDFWTPEAHDARLAQGEGILGIGTECYGPVKGEIGFLEKANTDFDISKFDHIVEGGIRTASGKLQIWDCPGGLTELEYLVEPGIYRARIYSSNLTSVVGDEGNDYYHIEVWPDDNVKRKLLKYYSGI